MQSKTNSPPEQILFRMRAKSIQSSAFFVTEGARADVVISSGIGFVIGGSAIAQPHLIGAFLKSIQADIPQQSGNASTGSPTKNVRSRNWKR